MAHGSLGNVANIAAVALGVLLLVGSGCRAKRGGGPSAAPATKELDDRAVNWGPSMIAFADIDGDGVEDFVGPCMDPEAQAPVSFCAFNGATFALLWRSPAFTEIHNAYDIAIAAVGRRGVFVDPRANAHVFDLASGRETTSVKLADRAREVCNPTEHPARLWFELETEQGVLFDPARGSLVPTARPASCLSPRLAERCTEMPEDLEPRCRALPKPPKTPGFRASSLKVAGKIGVALGAHQPGTAYPMLVGFDVLADRETKPRWSRPFIEKDPLSGPRFRPSEDRFEVAGDRVVTEYETNKRHLLAVSLVDGKTLWDVETGHTSRLVATASRVYAFHFQRLVVYDAKTGGFIGGIGTR